MTFADRTLTFNRNLDFKDPLPEGISIMNPFKDDEQIMQVSTQFYQKFYHDQKKRHLILGINPGRLGAGVTGIPFTDTKRLKERCGIGYSGKETHEPSSVFMYDMIAAYGGTDKFYRDFFIGAVCPLGFTLLNPKGRDINYNYYDSKALQDSIYNFIVDHIEKQIAFGIDKETCFILGCGKNEKFFRKLNDEKGYFRKVVALEHPRYIMQYQAKQKEEFILKYLGVLRSID